MATEQETIYWLSPKQYADLHGVPYETVRSWLRRQLLKGAQRQDLQSGEHRYLIPHDTPRPQLKRGPKPRFDKGFSHREVNKIMNDLNDKLTDEEREALRQTEAEHFFNLAKEAQAHLDGPTQNIWLDRLEAEHSGMLEALDYFSSKDSAAREELEMALYCVRLWEMHGHFSTAITRLQQALNRQAAGDTLLKVTALGRLGLIAYRQGHYQDALRWLNQSVTMARKLPDIERNEGLAFALNVVGRVHKDQGNNQEGKRAFEEALMFATQSELKKRAGWALRGLGQIAEAEGDVGAAKVFHTKSLRIQEEIENLREIAAQKDALGGIAQAEGDFDEARRHFEQSLALRQGGGNRHGMCECYLNLGRLEETANNIEVARSHFEKGLKLATEIGSQKHELRATTALKRLHPSQA
jgi:tetratricopeptide (TPR) repeat protein